MKAEAGVGGRREETCSKCMTTLTLNYPQTIQYNSKLSVIFIEIASLMTFSAYLIDKVRQYQM